MKEMLLSGQKVPAIGLGTWHMGDTKSIRDQEVKALQAGIQAGAKVIDTAEMYGNGRSEDLVGEAISTLDRNNLFLIDKVLPSNASKSAMEKSVNKSLKLLGTDYIDLYLYHWRGSIPLIETVETLKEIQKKGKIKSWGVSNFDLADMKELVALPGGDEVAANEDLYSLNSRGIEYSLLDWMRERHIPLIAYSPVAQGDTHAAKFEGNQTLKEIAANHNASIYQIILAWDIRDDATLAIPQTSNPDHAVDNVKALKIDLTKDELEALDKAYPAPNHKVPLDIL